MSGGNIILGIFGERKKKVIEKKIKLTEGGGKFKQLM
jgi:hypothetical protein